MSLGGVCQLIDDYYGSVSQADLLGNLGPVGGGGHHQPSGLDSMASAAHNFQVATERSLAASMDPSHGGARVSNSTVVEACARAGALAAADGVKLETLLMHLRACDERARIEGSSASDTVAQVRQEIREVDGLLRELHELQSDLSNVAATKFGAARGAQMNHPFAHGYHQFDDYGGLASKLGGLMRWQQKTLKSKLVQRAKQRQEARPVAQAYRYDDEASARKHSHHSHRRRSAGEQRPHSHDR